ncbi:hypothetical protein IWW37_000771 [Coemansia sp. RSA 2050]|nr:hypothetical protein IWW37_000771 [Coemansia sp. RSA 2050]KAJ2729403.1 hypothetical protein IW152_005634 [Coemansia sp. BCRC 34962]
MIFVFLVDTSVSMEQALSAGTFGASAKKRDESQPNESLFGGEKDRASRRWQRKGASFNSATRTSQHGGTRLECAKTIIEQILANRSTFEHDRYMLVTYNSTGSNACISANLKDSRSTLLSELRKLEANDRFSGGMSLTALFNQLSLMRGVYDLDTYGFGRYPTLSETVNIVWLTDGASVVTPFGVQNKLNLPVNNTPWTEAYVEPFRWDQRLILVLLHELNDSQLCTGRQQSSESTLVPMCMVMGGTVHHVGAIHQVQRFVDSLAPARVAPNANRAPGSAIATPGVLVNFERIDENPALQGNSDLRVLLHATPCTITHGPLPPPTDTPLAPSMPNGAQRGSAVANSTYGNSAGLSALINGQLGYFPLPEAFWPETVTPPRAPGSSGAPGQGLQQQAPSAAATGIWQIQRRSAHPTLGYSQVCTEWAVPPQFPFDKYQIDTNCNVAQKLLAAAQAAQTAHEAQGNRGPSKPICWPVFVNGSYTTPKNSGFPFGILRPNTTRTAVNLFVLPYNFAALWKILGKLDAQVQSQLSSRSVVAMLPAWRREFEEYLQHTPGYYAIPLKRAFNLYGIPHGVFPKTFGQSTGMRNITQYSVRLHNIARKEWARMHPGSGVDGSSRLGPAAVALGLQRALMDFDPVSDISHLVTNAFDVDRDHCLATLSAMRRVFVRECLATPSAYFRANAVVPPSVSTVQSLADGASRSDMDVDSEGGDQEARFSLSPVVSPLMPPIATMEYSLYGSSKAPDVGSQQSNGAGGKPLPGAMARIRGPGTNWMGPGAQLSPLGGLVDVASEDDRDTRHSVPIRDMSEYGAALHRMKMQEARDPLLDERVAMQQRRNMFGNPYRRPPREPRGPSNNFLARNPELSAKLGLSRPAQRAAANIGVVAGSGGTNGSGGSPARADVDDEAGASAVLEIESEAEVNELAIDKMLNDMPVDASSSVSSTDVGVNSGSKDNEAKGGKFWWMQRQDVPRRRSIIAPWRKNDESWNINPWASLPSDNGTDTKTGLDALTYTSDARLINRHTGKVVSAANEASAGDSSSDGAALVQMDDLPSPSSLAEAHPDSEVAPMEVGEPVDSQLAPLMAEQQGSIVPTTDVALVETFPSVGGDSGMEGVEATIVAADVASSVEATLPIKAEAAEPTRKVNVAEEKAWFLKRIKADPARYDEEAVLQRLAELQGSASLSKPQLRVIVVAAIATAKAMRRKQLVARLENSGALA